LCNTSRDGLSQEKKTCHILLSTVSENVIRKMKSQVTSLQAPLQTMLMNTAWTSNRYTSSLHYIYLHSGGRDTHEQYSISSDYTTSKRSLQLCATITHLKYTTCQYSINTQCQDTIASKIFNMMPSIFQSIIPKVVVISKFGLGPLAFSNSEFDF